MSFWNILFGTNDNSSADFNYTTSITTINPANGLPMINDTCIDIAGNTYGTDSSSWSSSSICDSSPSVSDWSSSSPCDIFQSSGISSFPTNGWD